MPGIEVQLEDVRRRLDSACFRVGREATEVTLIAVSKTFPAIDISTCFQAGQRVFGESRFQEAASKVEELPNEIEWHFIGRLQRNKIRKILPLFSHIHAVDSMKMASQIDRVAGELGLRPKIFLQVNQALEKSKGGFTENELVENIPQIRNLTHLDLIGLMTIPPNAVQTDDTRKWFSELYNLRERIQAEFQLDLPCLSMGMSGDYELAIEEGATHIRVGSAIFGKRDKKVAGELG